MGSRFGAFGKIPGVADFIQFGLPVDFVRAWDVWLQAGIVAAQAQLGEGWAERYNTAPIWRFALPAGAAGEAAMLGILMPSVDRVGRRFPLTAAAALPAGASHVAAQLRSGALLARVEDIVLEALDGTMSPSDLEERLAEVALIDPSPVEQVTVDGARVLQRSGDVCALPELAAVRMGAGDQSLWCAETAEASQAFAVSGLGSDLIPHLMNPFPNRSHSEVPA